MIYLFLSLVLLGVVTALWGWHSHRQHGDEPVVVADSCATCNGDNEKCEQECMMEAATQPIEYFDDEELDVFRGRRSDGYTEDEVEQFAYVLDTMQDADVRPWTRSLTLRGIEIPDELKDELFLRQEAI
ncbi:MAG: hypothetical protein IJS97_00820 [Prevotella sp.]|nr:hypothetical protein [Prevotella sp.]